MTADYRPIPGNGPAAGVRNLVITGYMGTGKSSVAHRLARLLGRQCVDMDSVIVQRAGKPIEAIFADDGEEAFRRFERDLCDELAVQSGLVISTGGGTLVDPDNRARLGETGVLVCLDCEPEELAHRLRGDKSRPMLWGDDPEQRIRELLAARRAAYATIPFHVDTTVRAVDQVAAEVLALWESSPASWRVNTPQGEYTVAVADGLLDHMAALLSSHGVGSNVVLVCDDNVWEPHGRRLMAALRRGSDAPTEVVLPAGERHKTLRTVETLYDRFVAAGLDRAAAVIALGGGVITDMAGFAAATFMRGVPLVQAPTSLLGMVDASVGGKVAVDHPAGKNLIGAFVRPLMVVIDPGTLATLPHAEVLAGLAEVIKHGIIEDVALFEAFESSDELPDMSWTVQRALAVKIGVVEEDPYEHGRRAVLNLGHTFAHAFEVLADFRLQHGMAVGVGTVAAAHLGEIRGTCSVETRRRIVATLERHGLPVRLEGCDPYAVREAMQSDKKRRGKRLRFVIPRRIGEVVIDGDVSPDEIILALERTNA